MSNLAKRGRILPSVEITVPTKGIVIERKVAVGQVVKPSDQLFTIADLSSVWVVGDVPEQSARRVKVNQHVENIYSSIRGCTFNRTDCNLLQIPLILRLAQ